MMQGPDEIVWSVSDFVAVFNQTLEFAYPSVTVIGELSNFRVSKNKWVYFDLKDEQATLRYFGSVYGLFTVLEDGMMIEVRGVPRLHPQFGFSITYQAIRPVGEGSIKRSIDLLQAKLAAEGLFEPERKRQLPYPPEKIGLIASGESAAYKDFVKVLAARWGGIEIEHYDVQVQGESAPAQIIKALDYFNSHSNNDVIVITRGGGSPEDLASFSTEHVTRAVAASRIPTLVAIGHEVDISLAELAGDVRASTPSNAAELLVPDKKHELDKLATIRLAVASTIRKSIDSQRSELLASKTLLFESVSYMISHKNEQLRSKQQLLLSLSPQAILKRGYAIVRSDGRVISSVKTLRVGSKVVVDLNDGQASASITSIDAK